MPFQYQEYRAPAPLPYVQYRSPYTGSLAQLIGSADRANAAIAMASGEAQARIAQNIGAGVSNTLGDVMKAVEYKRQHASDAQVQQIRQQQIDKENQRIADEATLTNVISGTGRTPIMTGGFTGGREASYDDATGQMDQGEAGGTWESGAMQPGGQAPGRQEILDRLPAHLQSTATKMFEESDKLARDAQTSRLALAKAQNEARDAVIEHGAHLGYAITKSGGSPDVTRYAINDARKTYEGDPEMQKQIDAFEQQIGDASDPKVNIQAGRLLANRSKTYAELLDKENSNNREITVRNPDGSETKMIVPNVAGTSFKSAAAQPAPSFDLAAYARGLGKAPNDLTFAEITAAEKAIAAAKHIEAGGKLTAEQHQDLVNAVIKNPTLFGQMTAATKEAIIPSLNKLGFDQFSGGLSAASLATAERWRTTQIGKIKEQGLQGAELQQALSDIETSYRAQLGGRTPVPKVDPVAPPMRPVLGGAAGEPPPPAPAPPPKALPAPLAAPAAPAVGMLVPGNINLATRPRVQNPDGTVSTVRSIGVNIDGKEVLIPTVVNGRVVSNEEAIAEYRRTGQHLGIFDTPEHSTEFAQALHQSEAAKLKTPAVAPPRVAAAAPPKVAPRDGTRATIGGKPVVWTTIPGKGSGWLPVQ